MIRRIFAVAPAAAVMAAVAVRCLEAQPQPSAPVQDKDPSTFYYAVSGQVDSLDPAWQFDGLSNEVIFQVYENLVSYDGESTDKFTPLLSYAVPSQNNGLISPDGLRYTFPIQKGVTFHDGSKLTPEDVRYSFLRFLLMDRLNGPSFLLLNPILGVDSTLGADGKPDPSLFEKARNAIQIQGDAVVITLPKPVPYFLSLIASVCPVVSKSWTIAHGGWDGEEKTWIRYRNPVKEYSALYDKPNGTGPFKLEFWNKNANELTIARNDNYWRRRAKLSRVVYRTVDDVSRRLSLLASGDADAIVLERQNLAKAAAIPGVEVRDDEPLLEVHDVFIPTFHLDPVANHYIGSGILDGRGIPPDFFADINVRKGFAQAFDYDAYIAKGYGGKAERARGPIPKGLFGYNPLQGVISYSPEEATRSFQKALQGEVWNQGFTVTIGYARGYQDRQLACELMKKGVEALNPKFHVDVVAMAPDALFEAFVSRRMPMMIDRWVMDYPDPSDSVYPFLDSNGYYAKVQGYSSPTADQYIEQARHEVQVRDRKWDYWEIQAIAWEDVPQIYTVDSYHAEVTRSWVRDWNYNPIVFYGYLYSVYKER